LLGYHRHFSPKTLTFCYQYKIEKKNPSFIRLNHTDPETGERSEKYIDVSYPESEKIFFSFKDDPWHLSVTNSWNFNWIHDIDGEIDIPRKCNEFEIHDSPHFNNTNLKNL
jgi:hypothetical protein